MVEQFPFKEAVAGSIPAGPTPNSAGSSNGRTADFGSAYRGSNPCPAADSTRYARSRLSAQLRIVLSDRREPKDLFLMPYFVYILRTSANTLYIGQTNNLSRRLKEHQSKSSKSAKYLQYFDFAALAYSEKYSTRKEAMQRETQLKKWTKKKKEALIKNF